MAASPKIYTVYETGGIVTIPFAVVNNTEAVVRNATLTFDAFPSGLTYSANYKDVGTYTTLTRVWSIPRLEPFETQTIYLAFTVDDLTVDQEIEANSVGAENADYPGEAETQFLATVANHPLTLEFQGWETRKLFTIRPTGSTEYPLSPDGTIDLLVTTSAATDYRLPALADVDTGTFYTLKVIDASSDVVRILADAADTNLIEGGVSSITMADGQMIQLTAAKSLPGSLWVVTQNITA